MSEIIYVLDTMAFLTHTGFSLNNKLFTVSGVVEELKRSDDRNKLEFLLNAGLIVREPGEEYLKKVKLTSQGTGDDRRLSIADINLLALALELKAVLVTDDYSQQNVAAVLGIEFMGIEESEITGIWHWQLRCKGCGRTFEENYDCCPVCGSLLKTSRKR